MPNDQSRVPNPTSSPSPSLFEIGLVDSPASAAYDKFTRLVTTALNVPVGLVSIVQEDLDRQFFTSQIGLSPEWAARRRTPLSHSFCQLVKRHNRPLIVEDAPRDARVCDNLAITDLGVRAYLGIPICDFRGNPIGALCAIDSKVRHWADKDIRIMQDLAACVNDQTQLRTALRLHSMSF